MSYKRWVLIAVILFGISLGLGLTAPAGLASFLFEDIAELEELSGVLVSLPPVLTALFIFVKNASTMVLSFILSPILCLAPTLVLTVNGLLIGFLSTLVIQEESLGFLLAGLLPHGVFELPALILAQAAAFSFGFKIILALFKRDSSNLLLILKQDLKYLILALVLLLPAAIIETYITPLFLT